MSQYKYTLILIFFFSFSHISLFSLLFAFNLNLVSLQQKSRQNPTHNGSNLKSKLVVSLNTNSVIIMKLFDPIDGSHNLNTLPSSHHHNHDACSDLEIGLNQISSHLTHHVGTCIYQTYHHFSRHENIDDLDFFMEDFFMLELLGFYKFNILLIFFIYTLI